MEGEVRILQTAFNKTVQNGIIFIQTSVTDRADLPSSHQDTVKQKLLASIISAFSFGIKFWENVVLRFYN